MTVVIKITGRLRGHYLPTLCTGEHFQFAGLILFQEKANALQYGRAFCDLPATCPGGGIYFENGSITVSSPMISMNSPDVYLRLRRLGATYTAYYSEEGENWILLGEHVRDFPQPQSRSPRRSTISC